MNIKNASVRDALGRLTTSYTRCMGIIDTLASADVLQKIDELKSVGHWGLDDGVAAVKDDWGISNGRGKLFHAQGDNMEGSLYTVFEGNVLRIRWAGFVALYLNSGENFVSVGWNHTDEVYILEPGRVVGDQILEVERDRVRIADEALLDYNHHVHQLQWEHEKQLRAAHSFPQSIATMVVKLFGGEMIPSLVLPDPPPPADRSIEELCSMLDKMRDGLERASELLAPFTLSASVRN